MIAWMCAAAHAGPYLQIGTGHRPLDVPLTDTLFGGGGRLGWDFGPVAPFFGGTVTSGSLAFEEEDDLEISGALWSLMAGARFDLVDQEDAVTPFLSAGVSFGRAAGLVEYTDDDEKYTAGLGAGPGLFGGFGLDAPLIPGVALGLEVGGHWATGELYYEEDYGRDDYEERYDVSAAFGYADLHATFRFGGGGS